jgi:hypothetical protein
VPRLNLRLTSAIPTIDANYSSTFRLIPIRSKNASRGTVSYQRGPLE